MLMKAGIVQKTRAQVNKDRKAGRMPKRQSNYPVIDLFAGPGGLGEGFALHLDERGSSRFRAAVSIECDEFSHQTLLLRHFFRHFPLDEAPEDYYSYLQGGLSLPELFAKHPQAGDEAMQSALKISLGPESHSKVRRLIKSRLGNAAKWALVGGPPCQAYSLMGRARMGSQPDFDQDKRHTLYLEYLRIIADHQPPVFVMENVKGLLSATIEGKSAINRIVRDLSRPCSAIRSAPRDLGYRLYSLTEAEEADGEVDPRLFVVQAENHGIPQARHRMFIVGVRQDLNVRPSTLRNLKAPTVKETIGSLPNIRSCLSKGEDSMDAWQTELRRISSLPIRKQLNGAVYASEVAAGLKFENLIDMRSPKATSSTRYTMKRPTHSILQGMYDERLPIITSHEARSHMPSDLRRYLFAATFAHATGRSPKLVDFPDALLPEHQNVKLGQEGKMFGDRFRVQLPHQVASTITSHISKDGHYFIHYDPAQCRSLTVREAARLQTFPDNYYFAGSRTQQYHQVGNAVPPMLARQIAEVIAEVLDAIPDC